MGHKDFGPSGAEGMKQVYAILVVAMALTIAGCVISPRRTLGGSGTGSGGGGTGATGGQLYVSTPNSILRFSDVEATNGNTAPTATITSASLSSPQHMTVDTGADRLYIANEGGKSIVIFDNASTLTGNVTPTRIIVGNATGFVNPIDVAVDTINNLLYVADGTIIYLFTNASTINGNVPPTSTINVGTTIGGIFLDATNNQLYFTDPGDNAVDRLDSASTQTVVGIVGGTIAGPDTKLSQPRGLALDGSGRLIVSNSVAPVSITAYASASIDTGDVIPFSNITGSSTNLQSPQQIAFNGNIVNGELYVVDSVAASILIYTSISTTQGNLAPSRTITGSSTGLATNGVNGLALDTMR
jgi:hypothetical protein